MLLFPKTIYILSVFEDDMKTTGADYQTSWRTRLTQKRPKHGKHSSSFIIHHGEHNAAPAG